MTSYNFQKREETRTVYIVEFFDDNGKKLPVATRCFYNWQDRENFLDELIYHDEQFNKE